MTNDSDLLKELGRRLRTARERAHLTQEQAAERAGISRQRYGMIEAGTAAARATTLVNIVRALGMEMMFVPQPIVAMVAAILNPEEDDAPLYAASAPDEEEAGDDGPTYRP